MHLFLGSSELVPIYKLVECTHVYRTPILCQALKDALVLWRRQSSGSHTSVHRVVEPLIYCWVKSQPKTLWLEITNDNLPLTVSVGQAFGQFWLRVSHVVFSPVMAGTATAGDWNKGWRTTHLSVSLSLCHSLSPISPSYPALPSSYVWSQGLSM